MKFSLSKLQIWLNYRQSMLNNCWGIVAKINIKTQFSLSKLQNCFIKQFCSSRIQSSYKRTLFPPTHCPCNSLEQEYQGVGVIWSTIHRRWCQSGFDRCHRKFCCWEILLLQLRLHLHHQCCQLQVDGPERHLFFTTVWHSCCQINGTNYTVLL